MKICEVSATFPPYMGGTGNVCYHNSVELAKLGHDVTVYTSNYPNSSYDYPQNISVKRLNYLFKVGNAPFLPKLLKLGKFDVIHLHYPFFFGAELVYLNSIIHNTRYVVTYHNDAISDGVFGFFFKMHKHTMMKLILNRADKIFATSLDYGKNSFLSEIYKKNPEKIIEISNGVDIKKYNPDVGGIRIKTEYGIENKRIILFVGGLDKPHYFKGLDILLDSFRKLSNSEIHLIIVGDGELKSRYIEKAKIMGINKNVTFSGRVSDDDLPAYYAAADVTVLPSITMGEAFGLVLVEAMATGKPVIASNLPGVRSVIDDGENGFLVEPGNSEDLASKLNTILTDNDLRSIFGKNGRKKVEHKYSWTNIAKKLEKKLLAVV